MHQSELVSKMKIVAVILQVTSYVNPVLYCPIRKKFRVGKKGKIGEQEF